MQGRGFSALTAMLCCEEVLELHLHLVSHQGELKGCPPAEFAVEGEDGWGGPGVEVRTDMPRTPPPSTRQASRPQRG